MFVFTFSIVEQIVQREKCEKRYENEKKNPERFEPLV